ncbi:MAG TPA: queuosine salvage family protein [Solirubrobacteraceae bacterium]|nr:queuosine salvage family protein [Solirubrobacteraceae bacterium]
MRELREACAAVAEQARHVRVVADAIPAYAAALPLAPGAQAPPEPPPAAEREAVAAFWLSLDAINFGSGWFPTLRKRSGLSGYNTIAAAWRERATTGGPWSAAELTELSASAVAAILAQDPEHELMALYARSLNDLGRRVAGAQHGSFAAVVDAAGGSAVALAGRLGEWECFADCSRYGPRRVPFLKRAQIAAADLNRAGVARFGDLHGLTMFADNLVPHVLRLDGVLRFEPDLVARIERGELIRHDSVEEIEIRACAVHAVELLVAAAGPDATTAAEVDQLLWERGQEPRYKASPRHRARCTAY